MSDGGGFDWGLTPRSRKPEAEPEVPSDQQPAAAAAEAAASSAAASKSDSEPAEASFDEDDLQPTEAMMAPFRPYRPEQNPPEPPAEPLPVEPSIDRFVPPSQYPVDPPRQRPRAPQSPPPPQPPRPHDPRAKDPRAQGRLPHAEPAAAEHDIDHVFGESSFREYDDAPLFAQVSRRKPESRPKQAAAPLSTAQRVALIVIGAVVALLVLVLVFVAGTRLPALVPPPVPTDGATAEPAPVDSATAEPVPTSPAALGTHEWNQLFGSECVDPFTSAWEESYTVVDCGAPHAAQLVATGTFDEAAYPGREELASQTTSTCTSAKTLDYAAAGEYDDLELAASYATTEEEWADGFRGYFCFVSRRSGEPLTGSLALTP